MRTGYFLIVLIVIGAILFGIYSFLAPVTFVERTVTAYSLSGLFALLFYFGVKLLSHLGAKK